MTTNMIRDINHTLAQDILRILPAPETPIPGPRDLQIEPMHGDGSSRKFYRVATGKTNYVAIVAPPDTLSRTNENDSYYYIGNHLRKRGIPVPEIYAYNREKGIIILEDLGDLHLQSIIDFQNTYNKSKAWYVNILEKLAKMNTGGARGFDSSWCFDTAVYDREFIYQRELIYFKNEFLSRYLGLTIEESDLENEFKHLAELVSEIPNNFLMHRDFQSRNIMIKEGKFYFIDFQGARFGPPTYDIASFLIDPYVGVPQHLQVELLEGYFDEIRIQFKASREEFINWYWLTALCRNLQILAAFVFLSQVKKKPFFAQFIKPALRHLCHTLDHVESHKFKRLRFIVTEQARSLLES